MSTMQATVTAEQGMSAFERTTSRWGRITMATGLLLSLAGPAYLVFMLDLGVTMEQILGAYAAVAATFLLFALIEPVTYFPILGQAAMYQAFMIGNIANKLLPAAVIAQNTIGVKPGSRKGDLAAVMAICGAALVHLSSLLIFVGLLGTWLLSVIPAPVTEVARLYVLPAILGAVLVQSIATVKQARTTVIAIVVSLILLFGVLALIPALASYGVALAVLGTVVAGWVFRSKRDGQADELPAGDAA